MKLVRITRKSIVSGTESARDLPITSSEILRWQAGEFVQDVWPWMKSNDREFLISGMTDEEQEEIFGRQDDWDETYDIWEL